MSGRVSILRGFLAFLFLGVFGALLIPWEIRLQQTAQESHFRTTPLTLGLREQIGQSGFLAALSGFRAPVAAFLWIEAHTAWEKTEWGRMARLFNTVTTLQPHTLLYWDIAAWHMAWNASISVLHDTKQKSEVLRERARRQYIQLGRDILENGIRNNPDSYLLYERLGILLRDKVEDHSAAADAFAKAASFSDAPAYIHRFAAYEMGKVPGRERETYDLLLSLYREGGKQRMPALITKLRELETKLDIPKEQRIPEPVSAAPLPQDRQAPAVRPRN
jgi:hypothetical protein